MEVTARGTARFPEGVVCKSTKTKDETSQYIARSVAAAKFVAAAYHWALWPVDSSIFLGFLPLSGHELHTKTYGALGLVDIFAIMLTQ